MTPMPTIECFIGLDRVVTITRLSGTLDWTAWSVIEFRCPGLSITKTLAGGTIAVTSADVITVTFTPADFSGKTPTGYEYQIVVGSGSLRYAVPVGKGILALYAAPA